MSTIDAPESDEVHADDEHGHAHPTDKSYVKIAVILAVLTAAEIATYPAEEALGVLLIPILMVLMIIKFWYVAAFFMHLKFDTKMFSGVFVTGILLAVSVYMVVLAAFQHFG